MRNITIAVLTRYPEIFEQCHKSVERFAPRSRKIVVVDRSSERNCGVPDEFYAQTRGWQAIQTWLPFSMARNAGIALMASYPDDVLYMGDDVQFEREDSVEELARIANSDPRIGILSPRIYGSCGHRMQQASGKEIRESFIEVNDYLVAICWFIKRNVIEEIGYPDLRFSGYGGDDVDYAKRALRAGWKLAVTDRVRVRHGFGEFSGTATFQMRCVNTAEEVAAASVKMEQKAWEEQCDGTRE